MTAAMAGHPIPDAAPGSAAGWDREHVDMIAGGMELDGAVNDAAQIRALLADRDRQHSDAVRMAYERDAARRQRDAARAERDVAQHNQAVVTADHRWRRD